MAITFLSRLSAAAETRWLEALARALPNEKISLGADRAADIAIVANPPPGALASLPKLAFVQSAWAGVDGLLADPDLPRAPIARLIDPGLTAQMAQATAAHVLFLHRQTPAYRQVASATDEAAAEAMFREARMFDAAVERMAQESAALDRMERGLDAY